MRFIPVLLFFAACSNLGPGETECNGAVCGAGQYCFGGGICNNGCTSDANCLPGSVCSNIDDFDGTGTCSESAAPAGEPKGEDPPPAATDPEASCNASIDSMMDCGLTASDAVDARRDCNDVTVDQAEILANCAAKSCDDQRACLGLDCYTDADCSAGQCVGNTCM